MSNIIKDSIDNDTVVIQRLGRRSLKWESYYGTSLEGKKGEIVQILRNNKGEEQGYRIRFPKIKIAAGVWNSHKKIVKNFEFAFYKEEIKKITENIEIPKAKIRRTRRMLESNKAAVRRLRAREGLKIKDLAERFGVDERTIYRWLNEKTKETS